MKRPTEKVVHRCDERDRRFPLRLHHYKNRIFSVA
jgi:hypothetical protein